MKKAGGSARRKFILDSIGETVQFNEWENYVYPNSSIPRWRRIFQFYTIPVSSIGYFTKNKGIWTITPEGEAMLKQGVSAMIDEGIKFHRSIGKRTRGQIDINELTELNENLKNDIETLEGYEEKALEGIQEFIRSKNPYEFQDMVAALLNAMGYHIAHIAPPGKDGGVDIIAYNDPLGTQAPRIIIQVKHKPGDNISSDAIQKLVGTMRRDSDVGIFATSGEFTNAAKIEARQSGKHVEMIDYSRFIDLWIQYYSKMSDEQKNMLPLHPIYFLAVE